jgi:hypothetical protein
VRIGVLVDPTNPMKVSPDFSRINAGASAAQGRRGGGVSLSPARRLQPWTSTPAASRPRAKSRRWRPAFAAAPVNTIKGSADQLLATGTHGTAVITTAMPLGKTVRDINPAADPSRLDDPVWIFTVEVTLAGQAPFPAVFGHRVPLAKLAAWLPGVKLAVAVNEANKNQEVAIDWDKSPIGA